MKGIVLLEGISCHDLPSCSSTYAPRLMKINHGNMGREAFGPQDVFMPSGYTATAETGTESVQTMGVKGFYVPAHKHEGDHRSPSTSTVSVDTSTY